MTTVQTLLCASSHETKPASRSYSIFCIVTTLILIAGTLSACSSVGELMSGDKIDYRSTPKSTPTLDIPPDLTQLNPPVRLGAVSASSLINTAPKTSALSVVPEFDPTQLRIERLGEHRWLKTQLPPEQVWPLLKEFWQELGFQFEIEQPELGLLETQWSENRAKLPQDFIRRSLGRVIDSLYSTGEQDKFRTRIERSSIGSEIYISHRGMVEVYANKDANSLTWQPRPSDPQLEAIFLQRLLLKLGAPQKLEQPELIAAAKQPDRARLIVQANTVAMQIDDNFDRAWRRVGLSLDRAGFTVEERDRGAGIYSIRHVDQKQSPQTKPGVFDRLFAKDPEPLIARFKILIKSDGDRSVVVLLNEAGLSQANEEAKRILGLLVDDLR